MLGRRPAPHGGTDDPCLLALVRDNKPSTRQGLRVGARLRARPVLESTSHTSSGPTNPSTRATPPAPSTSISTSTKSLTRRPARRRVTFRRAYYNVNQSNRRTEDRQRSSKHHTSAELKTYLYGDQIGTTGLAYINDHIKPTKSPRVYTTLDQPSKRFNSAR